MQLAIFFFITALIYACIGFGGGSTYNALLILAGIDYNIVPIIALIANILVVSGGIRHFAKHGYLQFKATMPWIICSVPAAWLGGWISLPEIAFITILSGALFVSALRMLYEQYCTPPTTLNPRHQQFFPRPILGAFLGLLAGLTGIGGGIFLAPILHLLHWGSARQIAGSCSLFIFVNSLAGLAGQLSKLGGDILLSSIYPYWLLFPAVLFGGQIGSCLGATRINPRLITQLTALLILYVALKLMYRVATML